MAQIQRKVYAVVELYDCFTRRPVQRDSCHVISEIQKNVIVKENGCFVFLDAPQMNEVDITFFSEVYYSRKLKLEKIPKDGNYRHQILWMFPNDNYVYPVGTTMIEGVLPVGKRRSSFHMVLEKEKNPIYLSKDYEAESTEIGIRGSLSEQFAGVQCIFYAAGKPVSELFEIAGMSEKDGIYKLKEPLKKGYKKGEAVLHRAYPVYEREDHSFFIAFSNLKDGQTRCDLLKNGKVVETWEIKALENGRKK